MGHVTLTTPFSGVLYYMSFWAGTW